jgi:hypothetical protein
MPMTKISIAALGVALIAGSTGTASACAWQRSATAETGMRLAQTTPAGDQARPARGPQEQGSVPTAAPPASPTQTTGATNQPPVVKDMNVQEQKKVEKEGK